MKQFPWFKYKKVWIAAGALLAAALLIFLCIGLRSGSHGAADPDASQNEPLIPDLLGSAKAIKGNFKLVLQDVQESNWAGARTKLQDIQSDIATVESFVEKIPGLMEMVPQADSIYALLDAADMAIPEILLPAVDLLEARPLSALNVDGGYDVTMLYDYIDFAESVMPKVEQLLTAANSMDLSILDSDGSLAEYLATANELMDLYHGHPQVLSMFKTMLGEQEDRLYLIAVQNPSEIRASGGFPGFMGLLRIENGILTLGDFETVVKYLAPQTPNGVAITWEESMLFDYLSTMRLPRDADLCPDFERVAYIWSCSYEEWHNEALSGIISITPHIVQRLLAATDTEIQLSDGWVMNGDNALKVLIHDIYFRYFDRREPHPDRLEVSDALFTEAAQKTLETLTGDITPEKILAYLPVVQECIADRTMMVWMKDAQEQAFVSGMGWNGGLNKDPQKPEAGVYVNVVSASKMGWFLLMDTEMGAPTENTDGSYTYPVTVTFSNNISEEEIQAADTYISGGLNGAMRTVAYFFAPAGGSVGNFTASNGQDIQLKSYNGLSLGFTDIFLLRPNDVITFTYTVTTAPGVDTPLVFSKTPTAQ